MGPGHCFYVAPHAQLRTRHQLVGATWAAQAGPRRPLRGVWYAVCTTESSSAARPTWLRGRVRSGEAARVGTGKDGRRMATTYADRDHAPARSSNDDSRPQTDEGGLKGKLLGYKERLERYAVIRVLESTAQGFVKDHVPDQAAAMTYYGVFSLFPLILLFMSLAGLALQSSQTAQEQIMNVVVGLLPQGQDALRKMIGDVIQAKGAAAGIGLLTLLWGALGWFQVIDTNINRIWGVSKPRSFIVGKLFAVLMIVAIGGVALLSFAATAAINLLAGFTSAIPESVAIWQAAVSALSVLTMALAFFILYRFAPQRRIQVGDVWPAALTTA